ncbi:MAG: hypothetical protein AB7J30_18645 [Hyphomicrobium sp.]|uniref:hypothetical protein n=1 Tax=Hyphomicrobium sp. TaxID=82 RepID=UPI003D0F91BC
MQQTARGEDAGSHESDPPAPVIVTVHGTNDADAADEGSRWWQRGSSFTQHLIYRLWERGIAHPELMWKRLSDAPYHNAYMRDDEVVTGVAEHLIQHWTRPN